MQVMVCAEVWQSFDDHLTIDFWNQLNRSPLGGPAIEASHRWAGVPALVKRQGERVKIDNRFETEFESLGSDSFFVISAARGAWLRNSAIDSSSYIVHSTRASSVRFSTVTG